MTKNLIPILAAAAHAHSLHASSLTFTDSVWNPETLLAEDSAVVIVGYSTGVGGDEILDHGTLKIFPKPPALASYTCNLHQLSKNGRKVLGAGTKTNPYTSASFLWDLDTNDVVIFPAGLAPNSLSDDGSVVFGLNKRWTSASGAVPIPQPPGQWTDDRVHYLSNAEGSEALGVITGAAERVRWDGTWFTSSGQKIVRWSAATGQTSVVEPPSGWILNEAWTTPLPVGDEAGVVRFIQGKARISGVGVRSFRYHFDTGFEVYTAKDLQQEGRTGLVGDDGHGRPGIFIVGMGLFGLREVTEQLLTGEMRATFRQIPHLGKDKWHYDGQNQILRYLVKSNPYLYLVELDLNEFSGLSPSLLDFVARGKYKPTGKITESFSEDLKLNPVHGVGDMYRTLTTDAAFSLPLGSLPIANVNAETLLELHCLGFFFSKRLGDASDYQPSQRKATFNLLSPAPGVSSVLAATWDTNLLTVKITTRVKGFIDDALLKPMSFWQRVAYGYWVAGSAWSDKNSLTDVRLAFAGHEAHGTFITQHSGPQPKGSKFSYTGSAALDITIPAATVSFPANKAVVGKPRFSVAARVTNPNVREFFFPYANALSAKLYDFQVRVNYGLWTSGWSQTSTSDYESAELGLQAGDNLVEMRFLGPNGPDDVRKAWSITVRHVPLYGSFTGLMKDSNNRIKGIINLTVTDKLAFTGTLDANGVKYPVKGALSPDGTASVPVRVSATSTVVLAISRLQSEPAVLLAAVNLGAGSLTSSLQRLISGPYGTLLVAETTFALSRLNGDPAPGPPGTGGGQMKFTAKGGVTATGRLADGTAVTFASTLTETRDLNILVRPYAGAKGLLAGVLEMQPGVVFLDFYKSGQMVTWAGEMEWTKPAIAKTLHAGGFDVRLRGNLTTGITYTGYSNTQSTFSFTGGGLAQPMTATWTVQNSNPFTGLPFSLKLTPYQQGGFSTGTFRDSSGKTRTYYLVPNIEQDRLEGFFLGDLECGRMEWDLLVP